MNYLFHEFEELFKVIKASKKKGNHYIVHEDKYKFNIFILGEDNYRCSCNKFVRTKLPCKHILKLLSIKLKRPILSKLPEAIHPMYCFEKYKNEKRNLESLIIDPEICNLPTEIKLSDLKENSNTGKKTRHKKKTELIFKNKRKAKSK